jgi:hypothetical protein
LMFGTPQVGGAAEGGDTKKVNGIRRDAAGLSQLSLAAGTRNIPFRKNKETVCCYHRGGCSSLPPWFAAQVPKSLFNRSEAVPAKAQASLRTSKAALRAARNQDGPSR